MKKLLRNNKKYLLIVIALIVLVLIIIFCLIKSGVILDDGRGLRVCPEEMIVNAMPGIDRSGETENDTEAIRSSYYILDGERREVDEFDTAYIAENCTVPVTSVY